MEAAQEHRTGISRSAGERFAATCSRDANILTRTTGERAAWGEPHRRRSRFFLGRDRRYRIRQCAVRPEKIALEACVGRAGFGAINHRLRISFIIFCGLSHDLLRWWASRPHVPCAKFSDDLMPRSSGR